jgi:hypothetical protein
MTSRLIECSSSPSRCRTQLNRREKNLFKTKMRLSISMPLQNGKASPQKPHTTSILTIVVIESEAKKRENCISTESLCVTSRFHYESRE